jgi:hypothetical protein
MTSTQTALKKLRPPRLEPLFPVGHYTPSSRCPHHGPIPRGSDLCCMICHQSGQDGHPALQWDPTPERADRDARSDWAATGPAPAKRAGQPPEKETRRQRRRRLFDGILLRLRRPEAGARP